MAGKVLGSEKQRRGLVSRLLSDSRRIGMWKSIVSSARVERRIAIGNDPNPPATSPLVQEQYVPLEERVRKFMAALPPHFQGIYFYPQPNYTISCYVCLKKAPEPDGIATAVLKHLPRRAMVAVNRVFNGTLWTRVIASFLHQRSFCVAVNEALSTARPNRTGVPQDSCLSLSLYATYTHDISALRVHLEDWEDDVMLALYTNDSAFFASSRRTNLAARMIQ
ncbi:RNA-directed DNA polymerase from mobile element jockey [Eumeta japonica]|uniref:RNA-directed DNA polymerase from mobile element jockey n=1 Tax=Eumeta variegata TaxID=151549 RepID=A0A4C1TL53_EUMVA|nr:RNA-directed DNA polymerase from mobile element jockey [Eumeta japonica]